MKLLLLIFIILVILWIRKQKKENYTAVEHNLIQDKNGKLFLENEITVTIGDKVITIPKVELDTGSTNFIIDKETSAKLYKNRDEILCEKGGWDTECIPYTYTSNFSGHHVNSNFYKGMVSMGDAQVKMGVGTNDDDFKYYSILGMSYTNTGALNFLKQYYKHNIVPRILTFRFNNLKNNEGGTFYMGKPNSGLYYQNKAI